MKEKMKNYYQVKKKWNNNYVHKDQQTFKRRIEKYYGQKIDVYILWNNFINPQVTQEFE